MKCKRCNKEHNGTFGSGKFCSRPCANARTHTKETKRKISKSVKKNPSGCVLDQQKANKKGAPKSRKTIVCSECNTIFEVRTHETRKYCSVECSNKNKYHPNSVKKSRLVYKGYQMDSGAELAFAKMLDKHSIKWEKNNTVYFNFEYTNGKVGKYYPDFYLSEYDQWIEIKGRYYLREDDEIRWKSVGPNHEVIFADDIILPSCINIME